MWGKLPELCWEQHRYVRLHKLSSTENVSQNKDETYSEHPNLNIPDI